MSLAWPAVVNYWVSFTLAYSRISRHEFSSLFIIVINLIFMFSLWCIDWVGCLYANRILCIFVLRVASGPRVKLAGCKSALNTPYLPPPPVVYSTDRSKAVVPVLVLLFVALWFILRGDLFYVLPCVILFLCFSVLLALRLPGLGKRELIWVLFVRLIDLCLFGFVGFLFLGVWEGLRFGDCGTPWTFLLLFFLHIWAWRPSCSISRNHLKKLAIPMTEGPILNLVKIAQAVSEKKPFKHFTQFYTYM